MRKHHSADTTARIAEMESIIYSLRGHLAWHKRRLHEQT